jgi:hypothetical protein
MKSMKNLEEWTQEIITHCRDRNCKGMLLSHPLYHEYKCSDCGKYWIMNVEWVEVKARARPASIRPTVIRGKQK